MQCEICKRSPTSRLPFNCTLCAREALHEPRIQLALTLLQQETLGHDVEGKIAQETGILRTSTPKASNKPQELSPRWALERARIERTASDGEAQAVLGHVEALRAQTKEMKVEIASTKSNLAKRRSDLESATRNISRRQISATEPLEKGLKRTGHRWDALHLATLEARIFLCKEAAQLYGLQQRKRKRGRPGRDIYVIGGIPIADLRELNNISPSQVTTSTTNLAHLVYLVSHYLTLRLPAEITLPHRDYPLPTIFSPGSSYTMRDVPFPGSTPSQSSNNSPSASRTADSRPLPRPRPLYIEKKLPALAKEDPVAYASFVEGMTLLAWDIAWICKTQGLNVGDNSWDEVCSMGKNLWQLLVAGPTAPRSPISRNVSVQDRVASSPTRKAQSPATMGHYSHGTAHSLLAAAGGMEYMRGWRLQSPVKVIEKVKAVLLSERTGAEWEILEGNEWEEEIPPADEAAAQEAKAEEEAVLVQGDKEGRVDEEKSDKNNAIGPGGEADEKAKGTSGWTKVKSRV